MRVHPPCSTCKQPLAQTVALPKYAAERTCARCLARRERGDVFAELDRLVMDTPLVFARSA